MLHLAFELHDSVAGPRWFYWTCRQSNPPYAVQTYPKRLQGGLVPLSPAAAGAKVLTSIREPNANGWCLWASGTVKLLTVVRAAL